MSFDLIKMTDKHMTRLSALHATRAATFYPSEASVSFMSSYGLPKVEGTCLRKSFFRLTNGDKGIPPDSYSEWIFALGRKVEEILVEQYKQMGIWVDNNVKFVIPDHNISGEIDVLVRNPETGGLWILEIKSLYGYHATRDVIKGTKTRKPWPKIPNLLQTMIYADYFQDQIEGIKLVYYARDSAGRRAYDVSLTEDSSTGKHYACVNGVIEPRFTLEDIYSRYEDLALAIETQAVPPNDFQLIYSDEKIETLFSAGELGKTTYEKWKKGKETIGDWQCTTYCPYRKVCWEK